MQDADLKEILAIALAAVPSHAGDNIRAGSLRIARSGSAARRATSSASTIARCRPTCAAGSRGLSDAATGRAKSAERRPWA